MTKYHITTPTPGFTGVSAGVNFTDGVAELEAPPPLPPLVEGQELKRKEREARDAVIQDLAYRKVAYFRSAGYGVEDLDQADADADGEGDGEQLVELPAKSAPKADWVDAAVARGHTREDAEKATKEQLLELLTSEGAAE